MEYFVYGRDNPEAERLLEELAEAHWSYMDGYADALIARGPTLTPDRSSHTGSMHIIDAKDPGAARAFAFNEPYQRAGVYREVLVRRWRNELHRTMWDFRSESPDDPRFLIIGLGRGNGRPAGSLHEDHRRYLAEQGYEEHVILRGPLVSDDGVAWLGTATLVEFPDRAATEAMVRGDPYASAGSYESLEVHDWQFGGRP